MKNIIVRFIFSLLFYKSGVSHFKNKDMFLKIVPSYLPFKHAIVKCSGILEFIIVFMYSVLKMITRKKSSTRIPLARISCKYLRCT